MRVFCILLVIVLLAVFIKVISVLARRTTILTPLLGWLVGLAFFLLAPLTLIVLNGGYESPAFYAVSGSHANVKLSALENLLPFLIIWASLFFSFLTILFFVPESSHARERDEIIVDDSLVKKVILVTTCLAIIDYVATIQLVGGLERFLVTNWYLRGTDLLSNLGDRYVLYLWLAQANQIVYTAAAV